MNSNRDMSHEEYFKELVTGKRTAAADRVLLQVLRVCSFLYAMVMRLRFFAYRTGLFRSHRLPRPVISIGNLVVGGTGKTPLTAWVADYLVKHGKRVAILTRGYGGKLEGRVAVVSDGCKRLLSPEEAGDEPCLLADLVPGLIVVMGSNRYEAGLLAMEQFKPDILVLDDGFQHLRLKRDLDILLMDATRPLGNGYCLPAGFLREPFAAAKRADLVVFTRCAREQQPAIAVPAKVPFTRASHTLSGCRPADGGPVKRFSELAGSKGLAFAGIADPGVFFDSLEEAGLKLVATLAFPDHTSYGDEEAAALARLRRSSGADYLITTAKDAVKLGPGGNGVSLYIADVEMVFHDPVPLLTRLDKLL